MGLFDQLAGQLTGALDTQKQSSALQGDLMSSIMTLINDQGGIAALLQKLQAGGLADQVASWIGTGENMAVSETQITNALGKNTVQDFAQKTGMQSEHVATSLVQLLPQIIDKLTPGGQLPQDELLQQGLGLLKGKLFG